MFTQPQIPRRKLGNTGITVSIIGFGASPLGSVFREIDESEGIRAVHRAFQLGINLFDTSPFYGITKSETVLGKAIAGLPRDQIVVASKVGRYGQDTFDFSARKVHESVELTCSRLGVEYLDLVQCHDIEFGDLNQVINETLPALAKLREEGRIRAIGITGLPLGIYPYVLDRVPSGLVDVVLSYCHCCMCDTTLTGLLPYLEGKELGIINASALSMGLLTQSGPPEWHPAPDDLKSACRQAAAYCDQNGVDLARLALLYAFRQPGIVTTLVGMCTEEEVVNNVAVVLEALEVQPATPEVAKQYKQATEQVLAILAPVKDTTWPSGLPENNLPTNVS